LREKVRKKQKRRSWKGGLWKSKDIYEGLNAIIIYGNTVLYPSAFSFLVALGMP